jgi:hypothetical protein
LGAKAEMQNRKERRGKTRTEKPEKNGGKESLKGREKQR